MNKLVSRNPVQRFKEGKKILKGEDGLRTKSQYYYLNPDTGHMGIRRDSSSGADNDIRLTQRYNFQGNQYGSFDNGKTYYNLSTGKPLNFKSNQTLLNAINRRNSIKIGDENKNVERTKVKTGKSFVRTPINWNDEFTNNFTNTLTNAQRQYLDSKGINYTNAAEVQKFLMDQLQTDLGGYKNDGKWGKNSIQAWKDFATNNIPENFDVQRNQETMTIGNKPYVEQPTTPTPTLGYRTYNTYEGNDFSNKLKHMGIGSNADLIDFMYKTKEKDFNWGGDTWARQFRSDVDRALGGQYSDENIKKVFGISGNWGKGFLGRGDIGDFQNALQINAGTWNGIYDNKLQNLVKNIDWSKFKYYKKGGQLPSRNIVERFKNRINKN